MESKEKKKKKGHEKGSHGDKGSTRPFQKWESCDWATKEPSDPRALEIPIFTLKFMGIQWWELCRLIITCALPTLLALI